MLHLLLGKVLYIKLIIQSHARDPSHLVHIYPISSYTPSPRTRSRILSGQGPLFRAPCTRTNRNSTTG